MQLEISPFTAADLMKKHRDRLTDPNTLIAAVNTLEQEGKIRVERSTGHKDYRDSIKIYLLL